MNIQSYFPIFPFVFVFFAFAHQDQHVRQYIFDHVGLDGQKYIGGHVGFNHTARPFTQFSFGVRKEKHLTSRNVLSYDLIGYLPAKRSSWIELEALEDFARNDTFVKTQVKQAGFQFQFSHRWFFLPVSDGKPNLYFSYGLGLGVFRMTEKLPKYSLNEYDRPYYYPSDTFSYSEMDYSFSGHAALGVTIPVKEKHSVYAEIGMSYPIFSFELDPMSSNRQIIPNFMNLKIGYRFTYKGRNKN